MMNFQTAIACCAAAAILAGCHNNNCNTVRDCAASQRCVSSACQDVGVSPGQLGDSCRTVRSKEHTSELQSHLNLVCRLLLEQTKRILTAHTHRPHSRPTDAALTSVVPA